MAEASTEVQIVPDFTGFVASLRRGIDNSIAQAAGQFRNAGRRMGDDLAIGAAEGARRAATRISDELAVGAGQGARQAARRISDELTAGAGAGARAAGRQITGELANSAGAGARQVGQRLGDQLAEGIGSGARRAAGTMSAPLAQGGAAAGAASGEAFARQFEAPSKGAIARTAQFLTTAFAGAAITATGLLAKSLTLGYSRATLIEDSRSAMNIILGSVEEAQSLMDGVLDTVTGTPFNLDQFADAAKTLVAFNIEADKVPTILDAIGTAAAASGRGAEGVGSLVNTFGQMAATGKVALDDVWSISGTGINALAILANHFGLTTAAMRDMISDGAVPAAESIDVLVKGIMEGSQGAAGEVRGLGGSMEALRKTVSGAVGGFSAAMARAGANVLGPFLEISPDTINKASQALDAMSKRVGAVVRAAVNSEGFQNFLDAINGFLDRIADKDGATLDRLSGQLERLAPLAAGAGAALTAMGANGLPFIGQYLPKINPLIAAIVAIATTTPQGQEALVGFAQSLQPIAEDLIPKLVPILEDVSTILASTFAGGFEIAAVAVKAVVTVIEPLLPVVEKLTGFVADNEAVVWGLVAAYTAWAVQARIVAAANAAAGAGAAANAAGAAAGAGQAAGAAQAVGLFPRLIQQVIRFKDNMNFRVQVQEMSRLSAALTTIRNGFMNAAAAAKWFGVIGAGVAIGTALGFRGNQVAGGAVGDHLSQVEQELGLARRGLNDLETIERNLEALRQRRAELGNETGGQRVAAGSERFLGAIGLGSLTGYSANERNAERAALNAAIAEESLAAQQISHNAREIGVALQQADPNLYFDIREATRDVYRYADALGAGLEGDWDSEEVQASFALIQDKIIGTIPIAQELGLTLDNAMALQELDPEVLERAQKRIQGFVDNVSQMLSAQQSFLQIEHSPVAPEALADARQAVADARRDLNQARQDDANARASAAQGAADRAADNADRLADAQAAVTKAREAYKRSWALDDQLALEKAERGLADAQRDGARATRERGDAASSAAAAQERLAAAQRHLAEVEASDSPLSVDKVRTHYEDLITNTREFSENLDKAYALGYNPTIIAEVMTAGPAEAGEQLKFMVSEYGAELVGITNAAYEELGKLNRKVLEQARITARAIDPEIGSAEHTKWAETASLISAGLFQVEEAGLAVTREQFATLAGITEEEMDKVAGLFDLGGRIEDTLTAAELVVPPVEVPIWFRTPDGFELRDGELRPVGRSAWEHYGGGDARVERERREAIFGTDDGHISVGWFDVPLPPGAGEPGYVWPGYRPETSTSGAPGPGEPGYVWPGYQPGAGDTSKVDEAQDAVDILTRPWAIPAPDTEEAEAAIDDVARDREANVSVIGDWTAFDAQVAARKAMSWVEQINSILPFRAGGIASYATGGIEAHVAQNQVIRYAEPSTLGEAFIPKRSASPGRSEQVARTAAGWLGGMFISKSELASMAGYAFGGIQFSDSSIAHAQPGQVMSSIAGVAAPVAAGGGSDGGIHIGQLVVQRGGTRGALALLRQARKRRWLDKEDVTSW